MKTKLLSVIMAISFPLMALELKAQDMFEQSLTELENMNNLTYDNISSFLGNPLDHANTLKVFEGLRATGDAYQKIVDNTVGLLSRYDNYNVRTFLDQANRHNILVKDFDKIIGVIAGYIRDGIEASDFEVLVKPLLEQFGWTCKVLPIQCPDIVFYEYSKGEFKILFAHNTRPSADYTNYIYNDNEVRYYAYFKEYRETSMWGGAIVRGGTYRVLQYKDNTSKNYHKITKATSKRLN